MAILNVKGDLILIIVLLVFLTIWMVRLYPSNDATFSVSAIEGFGDIGIYWDEDCIWSVYSLDWGVLTPGEDKYISVYVRNEGERNFFLTLKTANWNSEEAYESLDFSYSPYDINERMLRTGQVIQITQKLSVPLEIEISRFSFDILFSLWSPDIDGNGEVDLRDISEVARAYLSERDNQLYDESCDLNVDGEISLLDLILVNRYFGRNDL